jgi:hypothetical protein
LFRSFAKVSSKGDGPILELLTKFRSIHDKFIEEITKVVTGFQPAQFSIAKSSDMTDYFNTYQKALEKVILCFYFSLSAKRFQHSGNGKLR